MKKIKLIFAWYNLWVGIFYDQKKEWIYIFPVPCFGILIKLLPSGYSIVKVPILQTMPVKVKTGCLYQIMQGERLIGTFASDYTKTKLRQICWKNYKISYKK